VTDAPSLAGASASGSLAAESGWTGGQYSLGRAAIAAALALHFWATWLSARSAPQGAAAAALAVLSACLLLGFGGRLLAGLTLLGLGAAAGSGLYPHGQFSAYALVALALHAATPPAPFGSFAAFGRIDPAGGWRYPEWVGRLAWLLLGLECALRAGFELADPTWRSGQALSALLEGPAARSALGQRLAGLGPTVLMALAWSASLLKLGFALAAVSGRWRAPAFAMLLGASLVALLFLEFTSEGLGRLLLLPFAFRPAWIPPRAAPRAELLFYDGACGLCHRAVRFLLAEDDHGRALRFAPLLGERFREVVPAELQRALPDSLVLVTHEGEALDKSRAVLYALARLGGLWRLLAWCGQALPVALADPLYDAVARVRHRLFAAPEEACPLLPPQLRVRFDP
jgi:predicted DCC family thiol-disulfide oxidoreductase YuxK